MACSPVPRSSQRQQQQTAECRRGSGACRTVEAAAACLPGAWRGVDSEGSKDTAVEEVRQSFPTSTKHQGEWAVIPVLTA